MSYNHPIVIDDVLQGFIMLWHQSLEKKITSSRLQYWMYAVLHKQFGHELSFVRDPLHARYEVNRHGFSVYAKNMQYLEVMRYLNTYLQTCGYTPESTNLKDMSSQCFVKTTKRATGEEKLYISLSYGSNMRAEKSISVYPRAYWQGYPKA